MLTEVVVNFNITLTVLYLDYSYFKPCLNCLKLFFIFIKRKFIYFMLTIRVLNLFVV